MSYLIDELAAAHKPLSDFHWVKAAFGFAVFGLSGLYVAVRGKLTVSGLGSGGSGPDEENKRNG